jgi:hypothetical protein
MFNHLKLHCSCSFVFILLTAICSVTAQVTLQLQFCAYIYDMHDMHDELIWGKRSDSPMFNHLKLHCSYSYRSNFCCYCCLQRVLTIAVYSERSQLLLTAIAATAATAAAARYLTAILVCYNHCYCPY